VSERTVTVVNAKGLHAKCASKLVDVAKSYVSEVSISHGTTRANAKSIIGLMLLEAVPGTELLVRAEGPDEAEALDAIEDLFATGFGE
jgi:phosphotransferase system HPr (HPr) family protein